MWLVFHERNLPWKRSTQNRSLDRMVAMVAKLVLEYGSELFAVMIGAVDLWPYVYCLQCDLLVEKLNLTFDWLVFYWCCWWPLDHRGRKSSQYWLHDLRLELIQTKPGPRKLKGKKMIEWLLLDFVVMLQAMPLINLLISEAFKRWTLKRVSVRGSSMESLDSLQNLTSIGGFWWVVHWKDIWFSNSVRFFLSKKLQFRGSKVLLELQACRQSLEIPCWIRIWIQWYHSTWSAPNKNDTTDEVLLGRVGTLRRRVYGT